MFFFFFLFSRDVFWHELILQTVVFVETATSLQQASLLQDFLMFSEPDLSSSTFGTKMAMYFFIYFFLFFTVCTLWPEVNIARQKKQKVKDVNSSNGTKFARDETRKVTSVCVHPALEECSYSVESTLTKNVKCWL